MSVSDVERNVKEAVGCGRDMGDGAQPEEE